jgi:hypothetical protein
MDEIFDVFSPDFRQRDIVEMGDQMVIENSSIGEDG